MEYSLSIGKYLHEVLEEATVDDIAYFVAARNLEAKEAKRARKKAEFQHRARQGRR